MPLLLVEKNDDMLNKGVRGKAQPSRSFLPHDCLYKNNKGLGCVFLGEQRWHGVCIEEG